MRTYSERTDFAVYAAKEAGDLLLELFKRDVRFSKS
jgi:hypothetical protein